MRRHQQDSQRENLVAGRSCTVHVLAATADRLPIPGQLVSNQRSTNYILAFHFIGKEKKHLDGELLRAGPNIAQFGTPYSPFTEAQGTVGHFKRP